MLNYRQRVPPSTGKCWASGQAYPGILPPDAKIGCNIPAVVQCCPPLNSARDATYGTSGVSAFSIIPFGLACETDYHSNSYSYLRLKAINVATMVLTAATLKNLIGVLRSTSLIAAVVSLGLLSNVLLALNDVQVLARKELHQLLSIQRQIGDNSIENWIYTVAKDKGIDFTLWAGSH